MPKQKKKQSHNGQEPAPVPQDANLFINRELALLEFFMTRVSALKQQIAAGVIEPSIDGLTPAEQLVLVRDKATRLMNESRACLFDLMPQLDRAGIHICSYAELNAEQRAFAREYYEQVVFPVLTPLAYDPARPFPHISNMSLNLAVVIRDERGQERFARVKVPNTLPRLVPVPLPATRTPNHEAFVWMD